jgi:alanyl-tRNA synthetase
MKSSDIRNLFLEFFESKNHKIVDSSSMIVRDDPSLMFVNAGMNQFKPIFLDESKPDHPRAVNSQKCIRVSGKHNDLEEVGIDTFHHTFFEMLGNWSFGDYYKKEAIMWSWDLLMNIWKLDKERIWVTVYKDDDEAQNIWINNTNIDPSRVLKFGDKDNFWEMGDVGPCGPCSEIHVDIRSDEDRKNVDGKTLVNADHPQVIEVWNLVFMQYNRKADGSLEKLPQTHVDTGMGFEHLVKPYINVQNPYQYQHVSEVIFQDYHRLYDCTA